MRARIRSAHKSALTPGLVTLEIEIPQPGDLHTQRTLAAGVVIIKERSRLQEWLDVHRGRRAVKRYARSAAR